MSESVLQCNVLPDIVRAEMKVEGAKIMAKKPPALVQSKTLDTLAVVSSLAAILGVITAKVLSVIVLLRTDSGLLKGLGIATLAATATAIASFVILLIFDKPVPRLRNAALQDAPESVDEMTGVQFEEYVAGLLREAGWQDVTLTPATRGHGVDIIAVHGEERYAIQCKRYRSAVDTKAVQEVYAGKGVYDADRAVVVTNSTFTPKAREMAEKLHIELWEVNGLEQLLTGDE